MTSKSVLIIEDHAGTARLVEQLLESYKWQVEHVTTLKTGIFRANTCPYPEVIILDLNLPDSTTWETIGRIEEVMQNGPVIVHSNEDGPEVRAAVQKAGAVFCPKDFSDDYPKRLFNLMIEAAEAWAEKCRRSKSETTRIDTKLLTMAIVDSAIQAHAR